MIKVSCIITDIDGLDHYSMEDLIDAELGEVEEACLGAMNAEGDFFSMKVKKGVLTIPNSRIKEVEYMIEDMGEAKDDN